MLNFAKACALGVFAVLGLAACSSSGGEDGPTPAPTTTTSSSSPVETSTPPEETTPASDGGAVDVCALSADEVSDVMGFALELVESTATTCNYTAAASESDHAGSSVSFTVSPVVGGEDVYRDVAESVATTFETEAVELDGIGDAAFGIDAGFVYEIIAFQGDSQVVLAVTSVQGKVDDEAKELMEKLFA